MSIGAYTFQYDDDYANGGSHHRTWTACEMCKAQLPANTTTWLSGVDITLNIPAGNGGVIRVWRNNNGNNDGIEVVINGINQGQRYGGSLYTSAATILPGGSTVLLRAVLKNNTPMQYIYLPYT